MRALVTGAAGTNGRWIVERLLAEGFDVFAFDQGWDAQSADGLPRHVEGFAGDVADVEGISSCADAFAPDVIVHLAALLAAPSQRDPLRACAVNVGGTAAVLEAARRAGTKRVVFASSVVAYSPFMGEWGHPTYRPVDESYPNDPLPHFRVYGATKRAGEQLGIHYREEYGIEFAALRFAMILTPGITGRHFAGTPPQAAMIESAMRGEPFHLERGGDQLADYLYIKDLAKSVVCAATTGQDPTGIFNIGSGQLSSMHDLASAVRIHIPDARITIGDGLDPLGVGPIYCRFDPTKSRDVLGFAPDFTDLVTTVGDYIEIAATTGDNVKVTRFSRRSA